LLIDAVVTEGIEMERFEVKEEHADLWSVSTNGSALHYFTTEREARCTALMLAAHTCASGYQAMVLIRPPAGGGIEPYSGTKSRCSGM
jgi:hypothetical protein